MLYPSIRIEGAIVSPDILERIEDSVGQRPTDFSLGTTDKVKDEIASAWADAQQYWQIFQKKVDKLREGSVATSETRQNWIMPLLGLLGYQLEYQVRGVELNGKTYAISHRVTNRGSTPLHIIGAGESAGLDRKPEKKVSGMSVHAMLQEYINLSEELYGIVTNGKVLRLLRDSSRLVKLNYLEFDLERIFTDGLFSDFAVFYRLLHATRLPASRETASECLLERYHQDSLDSGARIRDGLSRAVKLAIRTFANGFLAHPSNQKLRDLIASKELTPEKFYQELLRLIYRILFLMVIEERHLIFPSSTDKAKREIYEKYYSLQRLRRLSEKRYLADKRHHDLWLSLLSTFDLFEAHGQGKKLAVPPLAGDLFRSDALGYLSGCMLGNDIVLGCLRNLGLYSHPDTKQFIRVNYAALNVEEFGSVYEGLLEFKPVFFDDDGRLTFKLDSGDERSVTGSHYTPDDLVQPLIKHSLDYLIAEKLAQKKGAHEAEKALLSLRVADISCGSGHILLAAARRIAMELAIVRTGEEQPSPPAYRAAIRDVIRECIYGVDLNPLAVELCKVALWLEAHSPGEPLNFLDHHIKCGNAIVGFVRKEDIARGIPDEAFTYMPGDEKELAADFRKQNKRDRDYQNQVHTDDAEPLKQYASIVKEVDKVSRLPETSPDEIEHKRTAYLRYTQSEDAQLLHDLASLPIAQFYIPKTRENRAKVTFDRDYRRYTSGVMRPQGQAVGKSGAIAEEKRFFHWFLEFPEIIERGGFDCVLGNPPYLGGQALSGTYGYPFCNYVKWEYSPTGLSELVTYFLRRIFSLLRSDGFTAFITTNSIKDGDVRKDGLEQIAANGADICFAVRGIKWPGRANLVVSLLAIHKGRWRGSKVLDGAVVEHISSFLADEISSGEPRGIGANAGQMYQGSIFLGDGFLLSHSEAARLCAVDSRNRDVIYPVINGREINNEPDQSPQRSIINFLDWPEERARKYEEPFTIVESKVKPERLLYDETKNAWNREVKAKWWLFGSIRVELTNAILELGRCFAAAATTKYLNFSALPTNLVYLNTLYVFTTDRWDLYSVVQSTLHEVWARKYSGALKQDLRYSPSKCFDTFPFPSDLWKTSSVELARIGEEYHEHRRALMKQLWLGLTDIYNLFHARDLTPELIAIVSGKAAEEAALGYQAVLKLRALHVELDNSIRDAYDWRDLALSHDFYDIETLPENDRVRYTISPTSRKEILRRLLALNHERAAAEALATPAKKPRSKKQKSGGYEKNLDMFSED